MKTMTAKTTLIAVALGLAWGAAAAATKIDLDEAIDDYSDVYTGVSATVPSDRTTGYQIYIDLDEAYYDYGDHETRMGHGRHHGSVSAEFAAFEPVSGSGFDQIVPWELKVVD